MVKRRPEISEGRPEDRSYLVAFTFRIGSGPSLINSDVWASKLKPQAMSASKRASSELSESA